MTNSSLLETEKAAVLALSLVSTDAAEYTRLTEADALQLGSVIAEGRRMLDAQAALLAGSLADRSRPEMGGLGLAQKLGQKNPEDLLRSITGLTKQEALTAVRVGRMAHEAANDGQIDMATGEVFVAAEPWMRAVVREVTAGTISIRTADAIRLGAGVPSDTVTAETLTDVVARAIEFALTSDTDRVLKFTKDLRDQVDHAGVAERERERHEKRSWFFRMNADGSARSIIEHDIVSAAQMKDLWDRTNSPKLVRFVDEAEEAAEGHQAPTAAAPATTFDERQRRDNYNHDTIMGFIRTGAGVDPSRIIGNTGAQITVLVTQEQLDRDSETGHGVAFIDGQDDAISVATVKQLMSCGTVNRVVFDENGYPIEPGTDQTADQRFFTAKQRAVLVAMFGGCAFGDCERPASWTEAHHIAWVKRDGGKTTVSNGILLCRHHHLLLHNNEWEIRRSGRRGEELYLVPPGNVDPERTPQRMRFKSRAYLQLLASLPQQSPLPTAA